MTAAVAQASGSVTYTDMAAGTPWFYGDPLHPATGNNYAFLNGHPTPLGHDYLAEKIAYDLITRYPVLTPQLHPLFNPVAVPGDFMYSVTPGTLLPAGTNSVSITFAPSDGTSFAPVSGTGSIAVSKASTSIGITSQTSGIATATVAPQISGTPTGQLIFTDGGVPVSTVSLSGGVATITLSPGMHTIAASYAGDRNFLASSSGTTPPITVNPPVAVSSPDFTVALDHSQVTVAPGAQTAIHLTVSPMAGLTGNVTLTCLGLPQNAACIFSPATLSLASAPGSTTLTIDAFAPPSAPQASFLRAIPSSGNGMIALCSVLEAGALWPRRRSMKHALLLFAVSVSAGLIGCGSGTAPSAVVPPSGPANTAPGQYNIQLQITANPGTASAVTHIQTVVLQVS